MMAEQKVLFQALHQIIHCWVVHKISLWLRGMMHVVSPVSNGNFFSNDTPDLPSSRSEIIFHDFLFRLFARLKALVPHLLDQPGRFYNAFQADSGRFFMLAHILGQIFGGGIVDAKSLAQ